MLAIEDLHWADRRRATCCVSWRSTCAASGSRSWPPTAPTTCIAGIRCGRWSPSSSAAAGPSACTCARSRAREVAEQIAAILGEPPAPAFVGEVFERAEGNAFCVEQLVATAREGGGRELPSLLEDILHARFERLSRAGPAAARRRRGRRPARARGADRRRLRADRRRARRLAARSRRPPDPRRRGRRLRVPPRAAARGRLRATAARRAPPPARRLRRGARGAAGAGGDGASHAELARHWHAADEVEPALAASVAAAAVAERRPRLRRGERALRPRARGLAARRRTRRRRPASSLVALLRRAAEAPTWPARAPAPRR